MAPNQVVQEEGLFSGIETIHGAQSRYSPATGEQLPPPPVSIVKSLSGGGEVIPHQFASASSPYVGIPSFRRDRRSPARLHKGMLTPSSMVTCGQALSPNW